MDTTTYLLAVKKSKSYVDSVLHHGILVGTVTNGGSFPTTRPDGSALVNEDYVKPATTATFPFSIGSVTFDNRFSQAIYYNGTWIKDAGSIPDTSEVPLKTVATEGVTGLENTQSQLNANIKNLKLNCDKLEINKVDVSNTTKTSIVAPLDYGTSKQYLRMNTTANGMEWDAAHVAVDDLTIHEKTTGELEVKDGGISLPKFATQATTEAGKIYSIKTDGTTELGDVSNVVKVDNLSVDRNTNKEIEVKDLGVTTAKLADKALTLPKFADQPLTESGKVYSIKSDGTTELKKTEDIIKVDNVTIENDATNGIQVKDDGITTAKIKDAQVTLSKFAAATSDVGKVYSIKTDGTTELSHASDVIGVDNVTVEKDTTAHVIQVKDLGISNAKLADGAVSLPKFATQATTEAKKVYAIKADGTTELAKSEDIIKVDNVTVENDATNGIQVKDSGVSTAKLADGAVSLPKFTTQATTEARKVYSIKSDGTTELAYAENVVKVDDVSIENDATNGIQIKDDGVTTAKIKDAQVTLPKFATQATTEAGKSYTIKSDGTTELTQITDYKRVSTFTGEVGNTWTMYYLDTPDGTRASGLYVWDSVNLWTMVANTGGSASSTFIGMVSVGDAFPVVRPDGNPLVLGDYVKPNPASTFPFTIGTVTFDNARDTAVYMGSTNWVLNANPYQNTSELLVNNAASESLSGIALYQNGINTENKIALLARVLWDDISLITPEATIVGKVYCQSVAVGGFELGHLYACVNNSGTYAWEDVYKGDDIIKILDVSTITPSATYAGMIYCQSIDVAGPPEFKQGHLYVCVLNGTVYEWKDCYDGSGFVAHLTSATATAFTEGNLKVYNKVSKGEDVTVALGVENYRLYKWDSANRTGTWMCSYTNSDHMYYANRLSVVWDSTGATITVTTVNERAVVHNDVSTLSASALVTAGLVVCQTVDSGNFKKGHIYKAFNVSGTDTWIDCYDVVERADVSTITASSTNVGKVYCQLVYQAGPPEYETGHLYICEYDGTSAYSWVDIYAAGDFVEKADVSTITASSTLSGTIYCQKIDVAGPPAYTMGHLYACVDDGTGTYVWKDVYEAPNYRQFNAHLSSASPWTITEGIKDTFTALVDGKNVTLFQGDYAYQLSEFKNTSTAIEATFTRCLDADAGVVCHGRIVKWNLTDQTVLDGVDTLELVAERVADVSTMTANDYPNRTVLQSTETASYHLGHVYKSVDDGTGTTTYVWRDAYDLSIFLEKTDVSTLTPASTLAGELRCQTVDVAGPPEYKQGHVYICVDDGTGTYVWKDVYATGGDYVPWGDVSLITPSAVNVNMTYCQKVDVAGPPAYVCGHLYRCTLNGTTYEWQEVYSASATSGVQRLSSYITVGNTTTTITLPAGSMFINAEAFVGADKVLTDVTVVEPTSSTAGSVTFTIAAAYASVISCYVSYSLAGVHRVYGTIAVGSTTCTVVIPADKRFLGTATIAATDLVLADVAVTQPTSTSSGSVTFTIKPYTSVVDCYAYYFE